MQIDVLKMGWCKIGEKDGAKAIADLILFNTSLTTLDLRGNGLGNAGEQHRQPQCDAYTCMLAAISRQFTVGLSAELQQQIAGVQLDDTSVT